MFCKIGLTTVQDRNIQWHVNILTGGWLQYAASCNTVLPVKHKRITKLKCHRTTNAMNIVFIQGGGSGAGTGRY